MFKNGYIITGSIATGKSSVCGILRSKGYVVVDADKIAHEELRNSKDEVQSLFGTKCIRNGDVDRKALGRIVFNDVEARKKLENILHPKIKKVIMDLAVKLEAEGNLFFIDIPLFFETNNYDFDKVVLVYTTRDLQLKRLLTRDCIGEADAKNRIAMQIDIEEKKKMSMFVIDNCGNYIDLQKNVEDFLQKIKG